MHGTSIKQQGAGFKVVCPGDHGYFWAGPAQIGQGTQGHVTAVYRDHDQRGAIDTDTG